MDKILVIATLISYMKYVASHWLTEMIMLLTLYLTISDATGENEDQS